MTWHYSAMAILIEVPPYNERAHAPQRADLGEQSLDEKPTSDSIS